MLMDGAMHYRWNRAHFGAWCVVSSPLILGLDVTDGGTLCDIIDVISNKEAVAINQEWAGHPGALVWSELGGALGFPAARPCNLTNPDLRQRGWSLRPLDSTATATATATAGVGVDPMFAAPDPTFAAPAAHVALVGPAVNGLTESCLKVEGRGYPGGRGGLLLAPCNSSDPAQAFSYNATTQQLSHSQSCVDVHGGGPLVWMYGCSGSANDQLKLVEAGRRGG